MSKNETQKGKKTPKNLRTALDPNQNPEKIKKLLSIDDNQDFDLGKVMSKNRFHFSYMARGLAKAAIGHDDWSDVIDSSPEVVYEFLHGKGTPPGVQEEIHKFVKENFPKFDHEQDVQSKLIEKLEPHFETGDYSSYRYFAECYKVSVEAGFKGSEKKFEDYLKKSTVFKEFANEELTRRSD